MIPLLTMLILLAGPLYAALEEGGSWSLSEERHCQLLEGRAIVGHGRRLEVLGQSGGALEEDYVIQLPNRIRALGTWEELLLCATTHEIHCLQLSADSAQTLWTLPAPEGANQLLAWQSTLILLADQGSRYYDMAQPEEAPALVASGAGSIQGSIRGDEFYHVYLGTWGWEPSGLVFQVDLSTIGPELVEEVLTGQEAAPLYAVIADSLHLRVCGGEWMSVSYEDPETYEFQALDCSPLPPVEAEDLYFCRGWSGGELAIQVYERSAAEEMIPVGEWNLPGRRFCIRDSLILVTGPQGDALARFDESLQVELLAERAGRGTLQSFALSEETLVARSELGLHALPRAQFGEQEGTFLALPDCQALATDNTLVVAYREESVYILELQPEGLAVLDSLPMEGPVGLHLHEDRLACVRQSEVRIYDLSTPEDPVLLETFPLPTITELLARGGLVYLQSGVEYRLLRLRPGQASQLGPSREAYGSVALTGDRLGRRVQGEHYWQDTLRVYSVTEGLDEIPLAEARQDGDIFSSFLMEGNRVYTRHHDYLHGEPILRSWTVENGGFSYSDSYGDSETTSLQVLGEELFFRKEGAIHRLRDTAVGVPARKAIPAAFFLSVSPNPFNPMTRITLHLPRAAPATVDVYNLYGQRVRQLHAGRLEGGASYIPFNAAGLAGGCYLVRAEVGASVVVGKALLLK